MISEDLAERMHAGVGVAEVVEALVADLADDQRVLLDGTVTDRPPAHDHLPVEYDWYGARGWLVSLADLCRRCGGFRPL